MKPIVAAAFAALLLAHPVDGTTGPTQPQSRTDRVQFGNGAATTVIKGSPLPRTRQTR